MKLFFAFTLIAFSLISSATELKVATITTDVDKDVSVFYLDINPDGHVDGMRYVTTAVSGQITEDFYFTLAEVQANGAVVEERNGYEVVRLYLEKFTSKDGGIIRLNYLVNGATHLKRDLRLKLVQEEGTFVLADLEGKKVNQLFFFGNYIRFLGLVGVREIKASFTP